MKRMPFWLKSAAASAQTRTPRVFLSYAHAADEPVRGKSEPPWSDDSGAALLRCHP